MIHVHDIRPPPHSRRGEVLDKFWALSHRERLRFIAKVRGGGSMAAEVYAALMKHTESAEEEEVVCKSSRRAVL